MSDDNPCLAALMRLQEKWAAEHPEARDGNTFVVLPGTDARGLIYSGMPCLFCKQYVAPGTGAQAVPPFLPAMHGSCMTRAAETIGYKP